MNAMESQLVLYRRHFFSADVCCTKRAGGRSGAGVLRDVPLFVEGELRLTIAHEREKKCHTNSKYFPPKNKRGCRRARVTVRNISEIESDTVFRTIWRTRHVLYTTSGSSTLATPGGVCFITPAPRNRAILSCRSAPPTSLHEKRRRRNITPFFKARHETRQDIMYRHPVHRFELGFRPYGPCSASRPCAATRVRGNRASIGSSHSE